MAAKFDAYARDYETLHANSIATSGEQPGYFADYKADCIERLVGAHFDEPILDYGCGVGGLTQRLCERFRHVGGFDPSADSIRIARERCPAAAFFDSLQAIPGSHFGLIVLANVLHHVPPSDRSELVRRLQRLLKPQQGLLVAFEHNPFNPLTRRAVAQCEFDDDAILLGPGELVALLKSSGFERVTRQFIVFFPRVLSMLRRFEPSLSWLPLGAQVMVVGAASASAEGA
jgi:ubiquinone/menaquinone biosynthesis C-methylase UbiE